MQKFTGQIVDIPGRRIFSGSVTVDQGYIVAIEACPAPATPYILVGFVDAHIHIESSMLTPREWARQAAPHGTVAAVCDPHEVANVCGVEGIEFMIDQSRNCAVKLFYSVPSCVPATSFEHNGACLDSLAVEQLLALPETVALAEVMNYMGVINGQADLMAKIAAAQRHHKPVDGHAPGLHGPQLQQYIAAGISTDHECTSLDEAHEKIRLGMKIQIRQGSSAGDFDTLYTLIDSNPDSVMLCSDDLKSEDLTHGHINLLVNKALSAGCDLFNTLKAASVNAIDHYRLPVGQLRVGDPADFILSDSLSQIHPSAVYLRGEPYIERAHTPIAQPINHFRAEPITLPSIARTLTPGQTLRTIGISEGTLYTENRAYTLKQHPPQVDDVLKIVVINRYTPHAKPAVGYVQGFGIQQGAFGCTIAHDSHNIVAVGSSDELLVGVINRLVALHGGIAALTPEHEAQLPLPIAGLMSDRPAEEVNAAYQQLLELIHTMGSTLHAPVMTLSFLALPVIPALRITDRGLFDVTRFDFLE